MAKTTGHTYLSRIQESHPWISEREVERLCVHAWAHFKSKGFHGEQRRVCMDCFIHTVYYEDREDVEDRLRNIGELV